MIKNLLFVWVLSLLGHANVYRFDYEFNEQADGWLKLHVVPSVWREARMRCHAEGAVLASPLTDQLKNAIIAFVLRGKGSPSAMIFTGVHASFSKGDYTSIEGVPLSRLAIAWAAGEPDNYNNGDSFLAMFADKNGSMSDVRCGDVLPYVCYKKFAHLTMTGCGTTDRAYHLEPRTGSCYKIHKRRLVWQQAYMTCLAEGGYLAIINSKLEAKVINEIYMNYPDEKIRLTETGALSIGFHDWGEHMTFMTINGETLEDAGFESWSPNQPDNSSRARTNDEGEFCGAVFTNGLMNDQWCNVPSPFICEKSLDSLLNV